PAAAADAVPNTACAPLGAAGAYNGFFAETYAAQSSDVEGRLAAGGNVNINHYSIADKLPATTTGGTLVVGGNLTFPSGRVYVGDILVRGSAAGVGAAVINGLGPNQHLVANATMPVDFAAEFARLRAWSDQLAALPANGTWVSQWGGLTLRGDNTSALQVFNLPGDVVFNSHTFAVERIPAGATVLFNLSGTSAGLRNMSLESLAPHRVRTLFNFPQATSLTLTSIGVQGSILAPRAVIDNPQGVVIGQVIARSWNGMMQLNHAPFEGCGLPGDNRPPVAQSQTLVTAEDTPLPIALVGTDPDNDALTYVVLTPPSHGTLSGTAPNVVYTPATGYSGPDAFTFRVDDGRAQSAPATVAITVTAGDDPPQAFDSHVWTDEDVPVALVLGASDPDGDALTYTIVDLPAHGIAGGAPPNLAYTPARDFHGDDRLTFRVNDGHGDSNLATVTITVRPINDAPLADDKSLSLEQGASVPVALTGSDPDGDAIGFRTIDGPAHGTLAGTAPNLTYTANDDYTGDDAFRYVANDGALDSLPATVRIVVTGRNHPPVIVSVAPTTVPERANYRYDVDATDPDAGDVLTYGLPHGAAGMSIDGASGVVGWPSDPALTGSNLLPNAQCAIGGGSVGSVAPAADVVMVVDESGSMAGEHAWIADMAAPLEAHLVTNGVGAGALPNRYGLIGYEATPRPINVGATAMGNYQELITATAQLRTPGGTEDGWRGIMHGLNQYPLREDSARNVILITDEDRDVADTTLTYDSMLASLRAKKAVLNAVVNARFRCGDNTLALGMGQNRVGYKADGRGGFVTCANVTATSGDGTTLRDYVDLALATGGAAWDIEVLRDGGLLAQSFTNALLKIKVQEILQQIPADPQPDLYVQALEARDG
ncbi:MAG TPA: choice-of-anchor A family protein, partial [Tahibacter sp.]|nr:choice-of-anchor A family protein [Tahibacter sp.]